MRLSHLYQTTGNPTPKCNGHEPVTVHAITLRDQEIIHALVHRVRVMSVAQIARTWWSEGSATDASRRLSILAATGLVHNFETLSHPELPLTEPVVTWAPGEPAPLFGQVSYRLRSRWNLAPESLRCVIATRFAGRAFGGHGGRFPRESERTHDLHMATVFLHYRKHHSELTLRWKSEARLLWERRGSKKEKLPDAVLSLPDGKRIVEFGGAYSKRKLESFHHYCRSINASYEVW